MKKTSKFITKNRNINKRAWRFLIFLIVYQTQPFLEAFQATVVYRRRQKLTSAEHFSNQVSD
jgi:hypothetical protein